MYGAIRAQGQRWTNLRNGANSRLSGTSVSQFVYELCYSVSSLDSTWGDVSRLLVVSPRFIIRNDSKRVTFEVKQAGVADSRAMQLTPGESVPFHWTDIHRPKLVSVRPVNTGKPLTCYRWSGGFDLVTIGAIPLRIRTHKLEDQRPFDEALVRSIRMESEIRKKTGGTGINVSLQEEDPTGCGSLFRIENMSGFPIWLLQDGLIADPSQGGSIDSSDLQGVRVNGTEQSCFALDIPFRQGKYAGRKAATMPELLRLRIGLAPLNSRPGIETTKVFSLATIGTSVRLNPSKMIILDPTLRSQLDRVRVIGTVQNDGPTTVLKIR